MLWTYLPSGVVPEEPAAAHCYAIFLSKWSDQSCQLRAPKRRLHPVSTNNYVSIPRQIQQVDLKHELIGYVLYILAFWSSLSTLQNASPRPMFTIGFPEWIWTISRLRHALNLATNFFILKILNSRHTFMKLFYILKKLKIHKHNLNSKLLLHSWIKYQNKLNVHPCQSSKRRMKIKTALAFLKY